MAAWSLSSIPRLEEALESSLRRIHDLSIRKEEVAKHPDLHVLEYHLIEYPPTLESLFSDIIEEYGFRPRRSDRREGPVFRINIDPESGVIHKVQSPGSSNMWNFYIGGDLSISFSIGVYLRSRKGSHHYGVDRGGIFLNEVEITTHPGPTDQVFQWQDHPRLDPDTRYRLRSLSEYLHENFVKNGMEFRKLSEFLVNLEWEHLSVYLYPEKELSGFGFSIDPYLSIIFNLDLRREPERLIRPYY